MTPSPAGRRPDGCRRSLLHLHRSETTGPDAHASDAGGRDRRAPVAGVTDTRRPDTFRAVSRRTDSPLKAPDSGRAPVQPSTGTGRRSTSWMA